jgi:hypothetical protein
VPWTSSESSPAGSPGSDPVHARESPRDCDQEECECCVGGETRRDSRGEREDPVAPVVEAVGASAAVERERENEHECPQELPGDSCGEDEDERTGPEPPVPVLVLRGCGGCVDHCGGWEGRGGCIGEVEWGPHAERAEKQRQVVRGRGEGKGWGYLWSWLRNPVMSGHDDSSMVLVVLREERNREVWVRANKEEEGRGKRRSP